MASVMLQAMVIYCGLCGVLVGIAGLITAWGLLGWLASKAWQGTLQRLGVFTLFFLWCRQRFRDGHHPRLFRWIFREDLPTAEAEEGQA